MWPKNFHNARWRNSLKKLFASFFAQLFLPSKLFVYSRFKYWTTADDWGEICFDKNSKLSLTFYHFQFISNQSRSCNAWNISIHEYSPIEDEKQHAGPILHQFCPRDKHKQFNLPWNVKTVVVKIQAMTRQARKKRHKLSLNFSLTFFFFQALYTIRWKSQIVRQKLQSLTPAPNVVSSSTLLFSSILCSFFPLFCYFVRILSFF